MLILGTFLKHDGIYSTWIMLAATGNLVTKLDSKGSKCTKKNLTKAVRLSMVTTLNVISFI